MTPHGRVIDVETVAEFDALLAGGAHRMRGWRLQGLDLTVRTSALLSLDPAGSLVLGCRLTAPAQQHLRDGGAVVFPEIPDVPVDAYRSALYAADELYEGLAGGYETTLDARIYAWSQRPAQGSADAVAQALHDSAIDDALDEVVAGHRVVGVMGGHAVVRGDERYGAAAALGWTLARGVEEVAPILW